MGFSPGAQRIFSLIKKKFGGMGRLGGGGAFTPGAYPGRDGPAPARRSVRSFEIVSDKFACLRLTLSFGFAGYIPNQ